MSKAKSSSLVKLSYKFERLLGENVYLLILAAIVGILGGFGAVVFRNLIEFLTTLFYPNGFSLAELAKAPWYYKILPPAVGGLFAGPLVYFFAREAKGHGVPEVMEAVSNKGGRIRKRVMFIKTLASAITISSGGSVGREGPIVQIGAGFGSTLGQLLGFEGKRLIVMLGCGAAAGMAATFNAPIAGVILAIEVIIGAASIRIFSPLVVASVMGTIVARLMFGDEPAFIDVPAYHLENPWTEMPLYIVLGTVTGLVAAGFTKSVCFLEDVWEKIPLPGWLTPLIGGALVGCIALLFPHVLGVGYETIENHLTGHTQEFIFGDIHLTGLAVAGMFLGLVLVKIISTGTTLGSGGSGGVFAPSLFLGACLGGAYGLFAHSFFPDHTAHAGAYALVGMGAMVAATTHAPITAILVLFELTNNYTIILPLMFACIIATVLSTKILPSSIYTIKLLRRGIQLRGTSETTLLRTTKVRKILRPFPETIAPNAPMDHVIPEMFESALEHLYVVDDDNRPLGVVTLSRMKVVLQEQDLDYRLLVAADLMRSPVTKVSLDDPLDVVMAHISRMDIEMLPVVDSDGKLCGCVTRHDIMVFIEHEIMKDQDLGMKFETHTSSSGESTFIELPEGHAVKHVEVTPFLAGRTLIDLDLRATSDLNVVGIRKKTADGVKRISPDPKRKLVAGETLMVVGDEKAIDSFIKAIE